MSEGRLKDWVVIRYYKGRIYTAITFNKRSIEDLQPWLESVARQHPDEVLILVGPIDADKPAETLPVLWYKGKTDENKS